MKIGKMLASAAALSMSGVAMTAVADAKEMKAAHNSEPALLQEWTGSYGGVPALGSGEGVAISVRISGGYGCV